MVYCTECGEENEEGRRFCKKCGARLGARVGRRVYRSEREMCFGVPMSGYVWGLLLGIIIVAWGASQLLRLDFDFWAIFAVAFGGLILWHALRRQQGA
jgi:hypothetical protein